MMLGRGPYELHAFQGTDESRRAHTFIPIYLSQPASYNATVLAFRLLHVCL
jgi:hypothetical protein